MANPEVISCPANEWTLVAAAIIVGVLHRVGDTTYLQTYRMAGEAAPSDSEVGVRLFAEVTTAEISASNAIDVYVKAIGTAGAVRVDR